MRVWRWFLRSNFGYGGEGGILTPAFESSCHVFSDLQKTRINIGDLTHSMASVVSTAADNWDGFCPSTDSKDTKAAVEQKGTVLPSRCEGDAYVLVIGTINHRVTKRRIA
jgi:hypothetical protein